MRLPQDSSSTNPVLPLLVYYLVTSGILGILSFRKKKKNKVIREKNANSY